MTRYKTILVSLLIATASVLNAQEQPAGEKLYRLDHLKQSLMWNGSYNMAGLQQVGNIATSYSELFYRKDNGGFTRYHESDNSFRFGVRTESFQRVKKVVFHGFVEYENFRGKNMTHSGQIYPERYLISVADDIPGPKRGERYTLKGGISVPVVKKLFGGLMIDYKVGNLAKMKDVRHRTTMLDFQATAGLMYQGNWFSAGANYFYQKFHERVTFSKIAPSEENYLGHVYQGLFFSQSSVWNMSSLDLSRPFLDKVNGGSVQLEIQPVENLKFFNEFTYKRQEGKSGEGRENALTKNYADIFEYRGKLAHLNDNWRQYLTVNTRFTEAENYNNIVESTNVGGWTVYYQYGEALIFARRIVDLNLEYEITWGELYRPSWVAKAGYERAQRVSKSSLVNPFYFTQDVTTSTFYGFANKHFSWGKGMLDTSVKAGFTSGDGDKLIRHTSPLMTADMDESIIPTQNELLLNQEYEFLTANRFNGTVGVRYARFLNGISPGSTGYVDFAYDMVRARGVTFAKGSNAASFRVAVGLSF